MSMMIAMIAVVWLLLGIVVAILIGGMVGQRDRRSVPHVLADAVLESRTGSPAGRTSSTTG